MSLDEVRAIYTRYMDGELSAAEVAQALYTLTRGDLGLQFSAESPEEGRRQRLLFAHLVWHSLREADPSIVLPPIDQLEAGLAEDCGMGLDESGDTSGH